MIGLDKLKIDGHYSAYFDHDDPLILAYEQTTRRFDRQDGVLIALRSEESFLSATNYRLLEDLTADLAGLADVHFSLSLTELGLNGETETVDGDWIPTLDQLADDGRAPGLLLSDDARTAAIWLQRHSLDTSPQTILRSMQQIRAQVEKTYRRFRGLSALHRACRA